MAADERLIIRFDDLGVGDVALVGGKNSSLGELRVGLGGSGVRVPDGFAVTAEAYRRLVAANDLAPVIEQGIAELRADPTALPRVGAMIRSHFLAATIPDEVRDARWRWPTPGWCRRRECPSRSPSAPVPRPRTCRRPASPVSTRATSTSAGKPPCCRPASTACRRCSPTGPSPTGRSNDFDHRRVALSVGVQRMVRSDVGAAGVMFTLDTESGFDGVVLIDAAWGLGEAVVKGEVDPDRYRVFKTLLDDGDGAAPILSVRRGAKTVKIVYASPAGVRRATSPSCWSTPPRRSGRPPCSTTTTSCCWRGGPS